MFIGSLTFPDIGSKFFHDWILDFFSSKTEKKHSGLMMGVVGTPSGSLSGRYPGNNIRSPNAGSVLGQRRRRWVNTEPVLCKCLVFAG